MRQVVAITLLSLLSSLASADAILCQGSLKHLFSGKLGVATDAGDPVEVDVDSKLEFGAPNTFGTKRLLISFKTPVAHDEEQIHFIAVRRQVHYENALVLELWGQEQNRIPDVTRLAFSSGTTVVALGYESNNYSVLVRCYEKTAWHKMNNQRCSEKNLAAHPAVKPFCDGLRKNPKKNFGEES